MLRTKLKNTPTTVSNFFPWTIFFSRGGSAGEKSEQRPVCLPCNADYTTFYFPSFSHLFPFRFLLLLFFGQISFFSSELLPASYKRQSQKRRRREKREREKRGKNKKKLYYFPAAAGDEKEKEKAAKIFFPFFPLPGNQVSSLCQTQKFPFGFPPKKLYVRGTFQCFSFWGNYRTYCTR